MTRDDKQAAIAKHFGEVVIVPDYFGDLNAVHLLRKMLTRRQEYIYASVLVRICNWDRAKDCVWPIANADAALHAEAIGEALNLWSGA